MVEVESSALRSTGTQSRKRGWVSLGSIWPRLRRTRLWREPLLHFLVLGALIFAAAQWRERADDPHRIVVDREQVARLIEGYADQYGEAPSPKALDKLIGHYADQEMLYREGKAMGLDREDEVVRRRIVQKTQFLRQDLNPPAEPDEGTLRRHYDAHAAKYLTPTRVAFSHVYFAADAGDASARARAAAALASLDPEVTRAPERGDAFPDLYDYAGLSTEDAARVFGLSDFTQALFRAPVGRWAGPFRSGYGWHLVRVSSSAAPVQRPFAEVRDAVRVDLLADARETADRRAMADLRRRYEVVVAKAPRP